MYVSYVRWYAINMCQWLSVVGQDLNEIQTFSGFAEPDWGGLKPQNLRILPLVTQVFHSSLHSSCLLVISWKQQMYTNVCIYILYTYSSMIPIDTWFIYVDFRICQNAVPLLVPLAHLARNCAILEALFDFDTALKFASCWIGWSGCSVDIANAANAWKLPTLPIPRIPRPRCQHHVTFPWRWAHLKALGKFLHSICSDMPQCNKGLQIGERYWGKIKEKWKIMKAKNQFGQGWRVLTWQATTNSRDLERKAAFSNGGLSRDCATSLYCWLCQLQILLHIYCCFFLWALASHGSHWTLVTSWMQVTGVNGLDHVQELDRSILSKILPSMHNMCCALNSGLKLMHVQTILYIIYLYIVRWNLWVAHWCSADAWQDMTRCKSILDHYPWQSCHSNAVARPCFAASVTLCAHTTVLSHHLRKRTWILYILHEIMNFNKFLHE